MTRHSPLLLVFVLFVGCKPLEPGPRDLNTALHDVWLHYQESEDMDLEGAVADLRDSIDIISLKEEWADGAQERFTSQSLEAVDMNHSPDPTLAAPMYTVTLLPCIAEDIDRIYTFADQEEIYTGLYDTYERTYFGDIDNYIDGGTHRLNWDSAISVSIPLAGTYETLFKSGMRRIPVDPDIWTGDAILLSQSFMPAPAIWEGEGTSFEQDYQIEVFFPVDEEMVHVFGVWRQIDVGILGDSEDLTVQRTVVNGMFDWDEDTSLMCEEGRP